MLKTLLEISVVAGTLFLGGCVSSVQYEYPYDVIRIHSEPYYVHHYHKYAYAPKPRPKRIYYYNRLWYDEPSTIIVRSKTDRVRVPNSQIKNHFNRMPKRDVSDELREMFRKKNEQLLKKRRNPNESTRIKRNSNSNRKVQSGDRRRRALRTRRRPSSGNDKGKDSNRVRIHDGTSRKGRKSSGTHER